MMLMSARQLSKLKLKSKDSIIKHRPRRIAVDKLINFTESENQQESDEDDQLIFKQPKRRAAR
jgi:hypothetical protein